MTVEGAGPVRRDECGQIGGIEGLIFGVLIFVFGTLVVANAWGVIDAKLATTSAAREAARTYVEAPSEAAAGPAAEDAAYAAIEAHGRRRERAHPSLVPGSRFARCERITIKVTYEVPLIAIPLLGQAGNGITVTSQHSEVVDPYRSGLAGPAACR
ncbi:MAG: hypothetical protein ACR2MO_00130 [Acidimicrobiales bacterium]